LIGSFSSRSATVLAAVLLCGGVTTHALDPARALSQYLRDQWDSDTAFPGGAVYSISQSLDGYLWIATEKGLVRFDGLRFQVVQPDEVTTGSDSIVVGLAPAASGGMWAFLRRAALVRLRNNRFEPVLVNGGRPNSRVTAMAPTPGGGVAAVDVSRGIVVERADRFEPVVDMDALPTSTVIALAPARDGGLWLGTRDSGLLRVEAGRVTPLTKGLPDRKINALLPRRVGPELWIGTDVGLAIWDGSVITRSSVSSSFDGLQILTMLEDRDANVWIGTASNGLFRVDPSGRVVRAHHEDHPRETVSALFEDRDGTIWIGTNTGLERMRDAAFTTYSTTEGLPTERIAAVYADGTSTTWFAPLDGGLYRLRHGGVEAIPGAGLATDVVYSLTGDANAVWVGRQRGGLTRIPLTGKGALRRFTQADGLAQNSVYSVFRSRDGAIWAGTLSGGVSRFDGSRFTTYTTADGLAANMVAAISETPDGAMWFATPNGLSRFHANHWRRFASAEGLPSNEATSLVHDRTGRLWIGTLEGLAFIDAGADLTVRKAPLPGRATVLALAEDANGSLWIVTGDRILRANRDQLAAGRADVRQFALADGLLSLHGVKRASAISVDSHGRVWIATPRGLSTTDPMSHAGRAAPGLVQIEAISADGVPVDAEKAVQIAPRPQRIRFAFAGLSLAVPERVTFRYRLDGFDADWSEPSTRRDVEYTNLGPGPYRFRVKASNSDGVWSDHETAVSFEVLPAFWQSQVFLLGAIVLVGAAGWTTYRLRLRHIAGRMQDRFDERLAERTRIAQELHDTLLQGVLSASMQLHVVADRLPADSPERPMLERVLALVRRVAEEGRNAVRGLRTTPTSRDLEQAFSGIPEELAWSKETRYRVVVDGTPKPLDPLVRDEVYCIGREALVNAFRHAQAGQIEVELEYASELRVSVRDDGRGIDAAVLQRRSDGHWGLTGMHERAERIGGRLRVWSRETAGTEVELVVPGKAAYRGHRV
jgi:ligand-binding sensor domain-containing protein